MLTAIQMYQNFILYLKKMQTVRLIVDTGIHAFGWTRDGAINFILQNSPSNIKSANEQVSFNLSHRPK